MGAIYLYQQSAEASQRLLAAAAAVYDVSEQSSRPAAAAARPVRHGQLDHAVTTASLALVTRDLILAFPVTYLAKTRLNLL